MGTAEERLDLYARLRRQLPGRTLGDALRLDGRALRFHLGTSLADLRVPVHVDPSLEGAFRTAVRDLFFLLCLRHRAALREHEYDRLLLLDGFDPRSARPPAFLAPSAVSRDGVRKAFLEAPELHPALDAGLWASWIGSGRPGRILTGALTLLFKRAQEEAVQGGDRPEPTPYLLMLALRSLAHGALGSLKDLSVAGPVGRTLHGAVAAGLHCAVRLALRESGVLAGPGGLQCEASALVLPWAGGLRLFWASGITAYGAPLAEPPGKLDQWVQKLLTGGTPETVAREAGMEMASSKEAYRRAARQVGFARLRAELLQLLRMVEQGRAPTLNLDNLTLAQFFQTPGAVERVLAAPAARKDLAARAKATAKAATNEPARTLLESISAAGREWKDDDPGNWIQPEAAMKAWSVTVSALVVDAALDRALDQAESQLIHRTGAESEGGIEDQHAAGKLYLFTIEDKPLLLSRAGSQQMGHLFCDMKDFTKRTAFLKETVVADFLSREFYGPILTAAARHAQGAAHLADKGGIYLNNLLGDAVSFSGDIVGLVELSDEIRRALGSYSRRLDSEATSETVAKTISGIEEKFRARRGELAAGIKSAQDALRRGTLDPLSGEEPGTRLRALTVEQAKLEEERETEISLATGEKLEAGIFISYGAAPEVATFEDHIFGPIKVSIAEKINESARGTARNGGVRARVDALIEAQRVKSPRPLACPLAVAVSQPLSMPVPADIELAVRRSIAMRDLDGAETVLSSAVRDFVARLAEQDNSNEDRGDIYNGGVALSEEALTAWLDARANDFVFVKRDVEVSALHASLRDQFAFPMSQLKLVMAVSHSTQSLHELFVFVGRALFKGFEKQGGLGVYEMVARENPLFLLLAQHHVPGWVRDQEEGRAPETGEWRPVMLGTR